jgi:hypothetical protein
MMSMRSSGDVWDKFQIGFVLLIIRDNFIDSDNSPCSISLQHTNRISKWRVIQFVGNLLALGVGLV